MAYDEHLAERIRSIVGSGGGITEKKMFGGLCFLSSGHMLVGITGDDLMVRVGPDNHEAALGRPHVRPMDFTGRPMKGMVFVEPQGLSTDAAIAEWIELAAAFVSTLPPKKK